MMTENIKHSTQYKHIIQPIYFSHSTLKMVQARENHKVIVYKNNFFMFGGFGKSKVTPLNTVEMYSFETNTL